MEREQTALVLIGAAQPAVKAGYTREREEGVRGRR
jgi:hypothetical protein